MRPFLLLSCLTACLCAALAPRPAAAVAAAAPSLRAGKVLLRSHFIGGTALKGRPDAARWAAMAATNAGFADLRRQTVQKLGTTPFRALQAGLPAGAKDHADLLAPLFDDLLLAESWVEWRGTATVTEQLALAVRLPDARAKAWSDALAAVVKAWTGQAVQADAKGWQARIKQAPGQIAFARAGEWVVVGLGPIDLKLWKDFQTKLAAKTAPFSADTAAWLDLRVDWPLVQPRLPVPLPFHAPETQLTLVGEGANLRVKGSLIPEKALTWKPEAWLTPTNYIRDPLISFTAARGIGALFQENGVLGSLGLPKSPSQLFLWGMDGVPFRTFAAAPYPDAEKAVRHAARGITNKYNPDLQRLRLGSMSLSPTNPVITWRGLPFIIPYLAAVKSPRGDLLVAGLFPNPPKGPPVPAALLSQFEGRNDLAYYDWEVTEPRLNQWRSTAQLLQIIGHQPQLKTNMAAARWLNSIQAGLGETVTEITVAGPRELKLTRKAPMGLNAAELTYLATWLEATNFPFSPFVTPRLPDRPARPAGGAKPAATNAPARR
jgi:hypothetical protein